MVCTDDTQMSPATRRDALFVGLATDPMFIHAIVGVIPGHQLSVQPLARCEVVAHQLARLRRKAESKIHVTVHDQVRLYLLHERQACIKPDALSQKVAIAHAIVVDASHSE